MIPCKKVRYVYGSLSSPSAACSYVFFRLNRLYLVYSLKLGERALADSHQLIDDQRIFAKEGPKTISNTRT
jgi:hypothetical protein